MLRIAAVAAASCAASAADAQTFIQTFAFDADRSSITIGSPFRGLDPVPTFSAAGSVDIEITFNGLVVEAARVVDFNVGFAQNPLALDLGVFGTATLEDVNVSMEDPGDATYFSKGDASQGTFDFGVITQNGNLAATSGTASVAPGTDLGPSTFLDLATLDPEFRGFDTTVLLNRDQGSDNYEVSAEFNTPALDFTIDGLPISLQISGTLRSKPAPLIPAAPTTLALLAGIAACSRRRPASA